MGKGAGVGEAGKRWYGMQKVMFGNVLGGNVRVESFVWLRNGLGLIGEGFGWLGKSRWLLYSCLS